MRRKHNGSRKFLLPLLSVLLAAPSAPAAEAASARCFMHGLITKPGATKTQLSDMIRLHFDADDQKKCELLMTTYCEVHVVGEGYVTDRLKGMFRPASKDEEKAPENRFLFDKKCKLLPDQEEKQKK